MYDVPPSLLEQGATLECSGCGEAFRFGGRASPERNVPALVEGLHEQEITDAPSEEAVPDIAPVQPMSAQPSVAQPIVTRPVSGPDKALRPVPSLPATASWAESRTVWRAAWGVTGMLMAGAAGSLWLWHAQAAELWPHYTAMVQRLIG